MIDREEFIEAKNRLEACHSSQDWLIADCRTVDSYRRQEALKKLDMSLSMSTITKEIREYIMLMATYYYGSFETDAFLSKMKCYEDKNTVNLRV